MLIFFLISLIVLVVALVISITFTKFNGARNKFNSNIIHASLILSISTVFLLFGAMLVRNPQSVFVFIHWLWILFGGIILSIIFVLIGVVLCNTDIPIHFGATQIMMGIFIFTLMIFGIKLAPKTTYELAEPRDINLLNNLPTSSKNTYHFSVVNDIDFYGFEFKESYGITDTYVVINGNDHTWSNINYETVAETSYNEFLDLYDVPSNTQYSKVHNLSIVNSHFSIIPNNYSESLHEGLGVDFEVITQHTKLENVTFDITIYYGEPTENIRSDSPSFIENVYPENGHDEENNVLFNVRIVKE